MWTVENRARYDRSKLRYSSDLTDEEWALAKAETPRAKRGSNKRTVDVREVMTGTGFGRYIRNPLESCTAGADGAGAFGRGWYGVTNRALGQYQQLSSDRFASPFPCYCEKRGDAAIRKRQLLSRRLLDRHAAKERLAMTERSG